MSRNLQLRLTTRDLSVTVGKCGTPSPGDFESRVSGILSLAEIYNTEWLFENDLDPEIPIQSVLD